MQQNQNDPQGKVPGEGRNGFLVTFSRKVKADKPHVH